MAEQNTIPTVAVKRALKRNAGVLSLAAKDLGCTRENVRARIKRSAELQAYLQEIDEEIGDVAVAHIVNAIKNGDMKTIRWYATLRLKHRGFATKIDIGAPSPHGISPSDHGVVINVIYRDATPELPAPEVEEVL